MSAIAGNAAIQPSGPCMATDRFVERRALVLDEADAIATSYLRAGMRQKGLDRDGEGRYFIQSK